jgi:hypothetical protein
MLRNIPEDRRRHSHRGGSLRTCNFKVTHKIHIWFKHTYVYSGFMHDIFKTITIFLCTYIICALEYVRLNYRFISVAFGWLLCTKHFIQSLIP